MVIAILRAVIVYAKSYSVTFGFVGHRKRNL
nr:MAG TPA: hypothetical protein [Caudoviricetes sp.]